MKKSELKNIIKECVREVILEEGMLSGIVTEVVHGMGASRPQPLPQKTTPQQTTQLAEVKKQVLDAVGNKSYEGVKGKFANPEYFQGTQPLRESQRGNALAGTAPGDPGVDISNIPGFGSWSTVASATRK